MSKQLSRRDFLKVAAASGAAASAASISGAALAATRYAPAAQDVINVTYATPGGVDEDAAWVPVWEAFNEQHDDIQANYMAVGAGYGPGHVEVLQTMVAAGNAPDVFFVPDGYTIGFIDRGVVIPIDSYVEANPDVDLEDNWEGHIQAHEWDGQLWGLPRDGAPFAMWYNADVYDEAGIPRPTNELTWNDFLEQGIELTQRDDSGRTLVLGASRGQWIDWVWQSGGDVFNEDGTVCILNQPEAVAGLQFMQSLVTEHQVAPSPSDLADQSEADIFRSGRMANFNGARGFLGGTCNVAFPFEAVLIPKGEIQVNRTNVGPTVIWSGSANLDQAFELLKFINSAEGQRLKISTGFAYPSRKSLVQEDWYLNYSCGESIGNGINVTFTTVMENNWARTWPKHPSWPEMVTVINSNLDRLWAGEISAEAFANAACEGIDSIIAEA